MFFADSGNRIESSNLEVVGPVFGDDIREAIKKRIEPNFGICLGNIIKFFHTTFPYCMSSVC